MMMVKLEMMVMEEMMVTVDSDIYSSEHHRHPNNVSSQLSPARCEPVMREQRCHKNCTGGRCTVATRVTSVVLAFCIATDLGVAAPSNDD